MANNSCDLSILNIKEVFLEGWWLIRAETQCDGKQLGVGGLASRGQRNLGKRVFCSVAITKRHSINVLETADGITVHLIGLINRRQTEDNGFGAEIICPFLSGFPGNWEEYAKSFGKKSADRSTSDHGTRSNLPASFDDLPVNHARDIIMSCPDVAAVTKCLYNDLVRLFVGDGEPLVGVKETIKDSPKKHKKPDVAEEKKDDGDMYEKPEDTSSRRNDCKKCKRKRMYESQRKVMR